MKEKEKYVFGDKIEMLENRMCDHFIGWIVYLRFDQ